MSYESLELDKIKKEDILECPENTIITEIIKRVIVSEFPIILENVKDQDERSLSIQAPKITIKNSSLNYFRAFTQELDLQNSTVNDLYEKITFTTTITNSKVYFLDLYIPKSLKNRQNKFSISIINSEVSVEKGKLVYDEVLIRESTINIDKLVSDKIIVEGKNKFHGTELAVKEVIVDNGKPITFPKYSNFRVAPDPFIPDCDYYLVTRYAEKIVISTLSPANYLNAEDCEITIPELSLSHSIYDSEQTLKYFKKQKINFNSVDVEQEFNLF